MAVTITSGTHASTTAYYGTAAGVQAILRPVIATIGASTPVTSTDITNELTSLSLVFDSRLGAAGVVTPVSATDAKLILDRAADLACAASTIERLMMGAAPTAERMDAPRRWRKESEAIIAGACSGTAPLPGVTYATAGGGESDLPGVTSNMSALPYADTTEEFVESYGPA